MEAESNSRKYKNDLEEVVYTPTSDEKNVSQLLHFENENKPKDSCFLYTSAFTGKVAAKYYGNL